MTPSPKHTEPVLNGQAARATFRDFVQEQVRQAIRATFIDILEEEVSQFIGAGRYERAPTRIDRRSGHRTRTIGTTAGVINDLPVPRTRGGFHTQFFARYRRRMPEVDELMREMFVGGISQQQVSPVVEPLTGSGSSPSTVSRVFHTLEAEFAQWQHRPLPKHYLYMFADGTSFSVIYDGEGQKMPILALIGIRPDGQREVVAFTRGVEQIDLWVTDGHQAMLNAIGLKFPQSQPQRCVRHKMENILSHVPQKRREAVHEELRAIFYQPSREQADQQAAAFKEKYWLDALVAVDPDGITLFVSGRAVKVRNIRTRKTRRRLQEQLATRKAHKQDTRSVRRLLKRLGRTQRTRTFCQQTAAKLVAWAPADAVLVFERLTLPQPSKTRRVRKGTRRRLSPWQRRLMRQSVTNAAERRGLLVADVNPASTSQDCARCGLRGMRQRHAFTCPHCGHQAHADVNAAINIRNRYTLLRQRGPLSTGPEALSPVAGDEGKLSPEGDSC